MDKPSGCLGVLALVGGLFVGMVLIGYGVAIVVLWLQCGPKAYFVEGVRYDWGHRFTLTDGKKISVPLQILWAVITAAGLWVWKTIWLPLALALERRLAPKPKPPAR